MGYDLGLLHDATLSPFFAYCKVRGTAFGVKVEQRRNSRLYRVRLKMRDTRFTCVGVYKQSIEAALVSAIQTYTHESNFGF